ncbi:MAG: hypothetical protein AB8B82_18045 [Roseovarius sp.]
MIAQNFGTIAALEFAQTPDHGFEDIVEEIDISFQPVGATRRSLIRDSQDIASFERDNLRVTLGWLPPAHDEGSHYLVLAVGPTKDSAPIHITMDTCAFVKDVLVDHLASYLSFETVFHAEATQTVGSDLVDTVSDILRCDYNAQPARRMNDACNMFEPLHDPEDETCTVLARAPKDKIKARRPVAQAPECSLPKRLTIYTLGATMLIYTPAVGASLLIYSTLRDLMPEPALQH